MLSVTATRQGDLFGFSEGMRARSLRARGLKAQTEWKAEGVVAIEFLAARVLCQLVLV